MKTRREKRGRFYQCPYCKDSRFRSARGLSQHVRLKHSSPENLIAPKCCGKPMSLIAGYVGKEMSGWACSKCGIREQLPNAFVQIPENFIITDANRLSKSIMEKLGNESPWITGVIPLWPEYQVPILRAEPWWNRFWRWLVEIPEQCYIGLEGW